MPKTLERKSVVLLTKGDTVEAFGSFTKLCKRRGLPYSYLKARKFPFEYKGSKFEKVAFNPD